MFSKTLAASLTSVAAVAVSSASNPDDDNGDDQQGDCELLGPFVVIHGDFVVPKMEKIP